MVSSTACEVCKKCRPHQYETIPCTMVSDRSCASLTVCKIGHPELIAATLTSDRLCSLNVTSFNSTPPANLVFASTQVTLNIRPSGTEEMFLAIFVAAVRQALYARYGLVSVTVFKVVYSDTRRSGSTVVDYRVQAMSTQIQDTTSFGNAVGDATALTMGIQSVGASVTNTPEYSNVAATVTSPPVVQGMAAGSTGSSGSSSGSNSAVLGGAIGGALGAVLLVVIVVLVVRAHRKNKGVIPDDSATRTQENSVYESRFNPSQKITLPRSTPSTVALTTYNRNSDEGGYLSIEKQ